MAKIELTPTKEQRSMLGDHAAEGKTFDLMTTYQAKGEKWCIVAIEDSPMPGYDRNGKEQDKSEFIETYRKARMGEPNEAGEGMGY